MESHPLVKCVRQPGDKVPPGTTPLGEYSTDLSSWDFPPPYFEPLPAVEKRRRSQFHKKRTKYLQVEPNVLNEACGQWDIGDLKTWMIVLAMVVLGLGIALTAYVLPHGRDTYVPSIKVY